MIYDDESFQLHTHGHKCQQHCTPCAAREANSRSCQRRIFELRTRQHSTCWLSGCEFCSSVSGQYVCETNKIHYLEYIIIAHYSLGAASKCRNKIWNRSKKKEKNTRMQCHCGSGPEKGGSKTKYSTVTSGRRGCTLQYSHYYCTVLCSYCTVPDNRHSQSESLKKM
jgi:hypothetical protein